MLNDSQPIAALERPTTEPLEKIRISLHIALRVRCPAGKRYFLCGGACNGVMLFQLKPVALASIALTEDCNELRVTKSICGHGQRWQ